MFLWRINKNYPSLSPNTPSYLVLCFNRVWHVDFANLQIVCTTEPATSAVHMNSSAEEWFRTTAGVGQGCLLSPTLSNIFLLWRRTDTLEELDGKASIGNRNKSTLVISKKGPSETLQDIRTSTYQMCRIEENTNRTTKFHK